MAIDPSQPVQAGEALLAYLSALLGATALRFAEPPAPLGRGFDTHIYAFRLEADGLEPRWAQPLVLRLYTTASQAEKAAKDAAVQRFASAFGYPALEPLAIEPVAERFGLPVMVMERVAGAPMLERMGVNPFHIARLFASMAEAHVQLHRLPVEGCPLPYDGPLVDRRLEELRKRLDLAGLEEPKPGLRWLEDQSGTVRSETVSLCHNDFHPLNIMVRDDGSLVVLDWTDAALGDRHHDVARTVVLFRFAWIAAESGMERLALRLARGFLTSRYLGPYNKLFPVDRDRIHYWKALQAFHGWLQLLELERASPAMSGARPEAVQRLPPELLPLVRDYFWELARTSR